MALNIRIWQPIGLAAVFFLLIVNLSWAQIAVPELKSRVIDLTATLSSTDIARLEQKLAALEKEKGSQVAVLILPTTQPESIEQYSIRVAEHWQLGRRKVDDGALLIVAKNDRALRIEVGYGLEGVLPDARTKQIIEQIIIPKFKNNNFALGIEAGVDAMVRLIQGESLPLPTAKRDAGLSANLTNSMDTILPVLVVFYIFGKILEPLLGRLGGAAVTSVGAGFVSWLLVSSIAIAIAAAFFMLIINLFHTPNTAIFRGRRGHWPNDHYGRGGGLGGGFGGGGGGGFGGGGGGFGGGGASGRW